ncbi:DUF4142 domain-containing protein [Dyadobacter sp. CY326]|uniref:DUF4142 domain-containing protein n=1 Tax=Dyadobacter sp. CY326 TaxID=2907300 RepID=UPI001F3C26CD|nr:DUF4142 domain-containing protein [Dyadobacter sp. CY326]MCE7064211.1 DUF4142 domain-containing protein [Dyadobacter sp. CY326]
MKLNRFHFVITAMMLAAAGCNDDDDNNGSTEVIAEMDKQFLLTAADGGLFEVNAGQVASSEGTVTAIKNYGQDMVGDHTEMNKELMSLADKNDVDLPTTLSNKMQLKLDTLSGISGTAFDTTYVKMMVTSHLETVNLFETQSINGRSAELKSWAAEKLPELRAHLEMARSLKDSTSK